LLCKRRLLLLPPFGARNQTAIQGPRMGRCCVWSLLASLHTTVGVFLTCGVVFRLGGYHKERGFGWEGILLFFSPSVFQGTTLWFTPSSTLFFCLFFWVLPCSSSCRPVCTYHNNKTTTANMENLERNGTHSSRLRLLGLIPTLSDLGLSSPSPV